MKYEPLGKFVKLSQGLAVNKGTAHLLSDTKTEEFIYPLLRIVDLENGNHTTFSKYVAKNVSKSVVITEDTIVFSRVTCQCFRGFAGVVHNNLFVVELISDLISTDYLFAVLQSEFVKNQALNLAKSSVVPDLTHDMFKSILIPVPDKEKQRKVAETYHSITSKISLNNSICADLEGMAKLLYDYWFVQFDFPDENGKPYKSSGGKMVWNEELKREIPEGWESTHFSEVLDIYNGKDHQHLSEGEFPVYGSGGLMRRVSECLYDGEAILIPRKGTLNNIMYVDEPFWTVDTMFYSKAKACNSALYLYYTLQQYDFEKLNTGSAVPSMTMSTIYSLKLVSPPQRLLESFNKKAKTWIDSLSEYRKENAILESLRDFLLPMLMNGQVKVKGA